MAEEYFEYKLGEILVEGGKPSPNICPEDETKPQVCFLISNLHAKALLINS